MNTRFFRLALIVVVLLLAAQVLQPYVFRLMFAATGMRAVEPRGELADIEKSTIALFERVSPSVVEVVGRVSNSGPLSEDTEGLQSGTGFIWDRAGDIVTNNHVVAGVNEAGIFVRRLVIPGAGHFWATDPFDGEVGSYGAIAAPPVLRFLEDALYRAR